MPPPNIVYNEYIHEDFRIGLPSGKVKVFYEPFENTPVFELEGLIFFNNKPLQNFDNLLTNNIVFKQNNSNKVPFVATAGFLNEQSNLVFLWNDPPPDHFLCVTYNFNKEPLLKNVQFNWPKEGF